MRCFYKAVLGPDAGKPLGKVGGGLPFADVLGFWKRPFESEDPSVGGCSALPVPSVEEVEAHLHESEGQLSVRQKQWRKFTSSLASGSHLS